MKYFINTLLIVTIEIKAGTRPLRRFWPGHVVADEDKASAEGLGVNRWISVNRAWSQGKQLHCLHLTDKNKGQKPTNQNHRGINHAKSKTSKTLQ